MKKTLITLLGVLVLCIVMVSCQNNPIESETVEVSFAPAVSKAINESLEKVDTDSMNVNDYYWDYWVDTVDPDKSTVEFKNFKFRTSYDPNSNSYLDATTGKQQKGLGTIQGLTRGVKYYFGLKGYSDADRKTLVWEGYTREGESASSAYRSVRIGSSTTIVQIHVWATGNGQIKFNISAPYDDATGNNDNASNRYKDYKSSYFRISWYQVDKESHKGTFVFDEDCEGFVKISDVGSDDTAKKISYSYDTPTDMPSGVYLFTVAQMNVSNGTEVPARKQVLLVNIIPGAVTTVEGDLDSTIGVSIDWDACKYMKVVFHSAFEEGSIKLLSVSSQKTSDTEKAMTTETDDVTITTGTNVVFRPTLPKAGVIHWYVNGVELDGSVLAAMTTDTDLDKDTCISNESKHGYGDGYITRADLEDPIPNTPSYVRQLQYANPFESYAYVENNVLTFHRGGKASTDEADVGTDPKYDGYDRNRYIFTAVFIGDNIDDSASFSFTVGYSEN